MSKWIKRLSHIFYVKAYKFFRDTLNNYPLAWKWERIAKRLDYRMEVKSCVQ